jgi:hypothetical protein
VGLGVGDALPLGLWMGKAKVADAEAVGGGEPDGVGDVADGVEVEVAVGEGVGVGGGGIIFSQ